MRTSIPVGGFTKNYDSRRGRGDLINAQVEFNGQGDFFRIRKSAGLKEFRDIGSGPIRGMFRVKGTVFVASGSKLFAVTLSGSTELGDIGGYRDLVKFAANGTDVNQIIVISEQVGFTYDDTNGLQEITDPDFNADYSVASLNQIFWVNKRDSNEFQGSSTANGTDWPALRVASAEQSPDPVVYLSQKKSAIWVMGTRTCEYWQTDTSDVDVPLRPVLGATIERGVGSQKSVAEYQDSIFFIADDFSVYQIDGTSSRKISDISLEYAINGDGFTAGYINPQNAEGFFVDHPSHKLYVLTFIENKITWVFDLTTGLWHKRSSKETGYWRGRTSVLAFNKVLVGDAVTGKIWELDENTYTEGGAEIEVEITTPPVVAQSNDLYVNYIEPLVEVGRTEFTSVVNDVLKAELIDSYLQVEYSKNGGLTYKSKSSIKLGQAGNYEKITRKHQFGRTKKGFEFVLRFTIASNSPFFMYEIYADLDNGG